MAIPELTLLEGDSGMITITVDANPQANNTLIRVDRSSPSTRITVDSSEVNISVVTFSMVNRADAVYQHLQPQCYSTDHFRSEL